MEVERELIAAALPGYDLGAVLGRGAAGLVVAAEHRQLGRAVAIKQLASTDLDDATVRHRFLSEARLLARLVHPHIVPVYDYVEHEGMCLLVMEQLRGGTLWERFRSEGLSAPAAVAAALATLSALEHGHGEGVLHRDVKPANLLFGDDGVLKVTDFGIAKLTGADATQATRVGDVLGTPAYMAPEQAQGDDVGPPADVYAVAVVLYELLSGRLPFSSEGGPMAVMYRHVHEDPKPLVEAAPSVPEPIATVTQSGLARDLAERPDRAERFGVLLATAATSAWGPGWLDRAGIPLVKPGPILTAATRAGPEVTRPAPERADGEDTAAGATMVTRPVGHAPAADDDGVVAAPAAPDQPEFSGPDAEDEPAPNEPAPNEPAPNGEASVDAAGGPEPDEGPSEPPATGPDRPFSAASESLAAAVDDDAVPVSPEGTAVLMVLEGPDLDEGELSEVAHRRGGSVVGFVAEAAVLGFPTAHAPMEAALELAPALRGDGADEPGGRMALHGSVAADDAESRRRVVDLTRAIAAVAEPGEVLVSASMRGMVGGSPGIVFSSERPVRLPPDGLSQRVSVLQVGGRAGPRA